MKKTSPRPSGNAGVVTYIQPHLIPHLILRGVIGLFALARRRVENPSRRNVGGLRIGLFNPIAEALEFPDHSGDAVSL
jgi:hypothetical protein